MKFFNENILWIKINLEGLTISDLKEEEKKEIIKEIKDIKKRNPDVEKVSVIFHSEYDEDVLCDEELEEVE